MLTPSAHAYVQYVREEKAKVIFTLLPRYTAQGGVCCQSATPQ